MSGPNQAVRLWGSYLKQQQQVLSGLEAGTASKEQLASLVHSLREFDDVKGLPRAAWKKLVVELEVPKQLGIACCQLAVYADDELLMRAVVSQVCGFAECAHADTHSTTYQPVSDSLKVKTLQQLQDSGFLQLLTRLLAHAAAALPHVDARTECSSDPSNSSRSSRGSKRRQRNARRTDGRSMSALSQHFNWSGLLLALTSDILTLCSEIEDDSQLPASGAAAVELWPLQMQLAAAALQYTTKWVQELPKGSELPAACALLTSCAFEAVGNAAVSLSFVLMLAHLQPSAAQQLPLLQLPEYFFCVCVAGTQTVLARMIANDPAAITAIRQGSAALPSSSSSSSRGSAVAEVPDDEAMQAVWQLCRKLHKQVPLPVQQLLRKLGCSTKLILCAAAAKRQLPGFEEAAIQVSALTAAPFLHNGNAGPLQLQRRQRVGALTPHQVAPLVSVLMLFWAKTEQSHTSTFTSALAKALEVFAQLLPGPTRGEHRQQQEDAAAAVEQQLPLDSYQELLGLITDCLQALQPMLLRTTPAPPAAAASSNGLGAPSGEEYKQLLFEAGGLYTTGLAKRLIVLSEYSVADSAAKQTGTGSGPAPPGPGTAATAGLMGQLSVAGVWALHAERLAAALELHVRVSPASLLGDNLTIATMLLDQLVTGSSLTNSMDNICNCGIRNSSSSSNAGGSGLMMGDVVREEGTGPVLQTILQHPAEEISIEGALSAEGAGPLLQAVLQQPQDSRQELQLFGLLVSLLKRASLSGCCPEPQVNTAHTSSSSSNGGGGGGGGGMQLAATAKVLTHVGWASIVLLRQRSGGSSEAAAQASSRGSTSAAALASNIAAAAVGAACAESQGDPARETAGVGGAMSGMLPYLWLLGRCCMQYAQLCRTAKEAIATYAGLQPSADGASSSSSGGGGGAGGSGGKPWLGSGFRLEYMTLLTEHYKLRCVLTPLLGELVSDVNTLAYLAVMGLSKRLQALSSDGLAEMSGLSDFAACPQVAVNAMHQCAAVMEEFGVFFSACPHARACNNAVCFNPSGPSEQHLVRSRSCTCSGCRTARYCSTDCQRHVWKQHKPVCKALGRVLQEAKRDGAEAVAQGSA